METFRFQRSEETFHCRIVQAVSIAGHTLNQTVVFQLLLINIMDMPFQIGIFVFCRLDGQLVIEGAAWQSDNLQQQFQRMALP
ncbi:TPA: hypothetical protein ACFP4U_001957 [Neisseria lactamica]|uniref:hypothetical protein n=1 Tax=Neisseria lactamica TaxID=486 RepID=UPI001EFE68D7|nr:hypothetical protein [Neisseria lactamica]